MSFDLLPAPGHDAPEPPMPAAVLRLWDAQTLTLPLALMQRRQADGMTGVAFARKGPSRRGYGHRAEVVPADGTPITLTF